MKHELDVIADIFSRIRDAEAKAQRRMDEAMACQLEADIRQAWGGDKVHIARTPRLAQAARQNRVHRAYLDGKRLAEIARQEGVSTRWVSKLIKK